MGLDGNESIPILMIIAAVVILPVTGIALSGYVGYFRRRARHRRWWTEPVMWCVAGGVAAFGLVQVLGS